MKSFLEHPGLFESFKAAHCLVCHPDPYQFFIFFMLSHVIFFPVCVHHEFVLPHIDGKEVVLHEKGVSTNEQGHHLVL